MLEQKQALKCISYNYWEEVDHKVVVVKQKKIFLPKDSQLTSAFTTIYLFKCVLFLNHVHIFCIQNWHLWWGDRNLI